MTDGGFDESFGSFQTQGGREHADSKVSMGSRQAAGSLMPKKRPLAGGRTASEQAPTTEKSGLFSNLGKMVGANRRASKLDSLSSSQTQPIAVSTSTSYVDKLPDNFDKKAVKRNPCEACMLCENIFTKKFAILNRNPIRHCKRCGKSICEVCSDQKRILSKADPTPFRICDLCDFEMDNNQLK